MLYYHASSSFHKGDVLAETVRVFEERIGFSPAAGVIDDTHIPTIRPDYYNRKGFYSLVMQAVVDSKYRFIDLCLRWPGSIHNVRVLANSTLYVKEQENSLFFGHVDMVKEIESVDIPLLLWGDPAYPLLYVFQI